MALRKIVLLREKESFGRSWTARSFGPAGVELASNVKVAGVEFHEQIQAVPIYRRMPARVSVATAALGNPVRPAGMPHNAYAVVGMFDDEEAVARMKQDRSDEVLGVYADPKIEVAPAYCRRGPVGATSDVIAATRVAPLHRQGLFGKNVRIAIVDTGIDGTYTGPDGETLSKKIDAKRGYPAGIGPGTSNIGHGTMVAYDALIAAPRATLLDYAVLKPAATGQDFSGFISE